MTKIQIENIIAYTQISDLLDIKFLSEKIIDSNYNPSEFNGLSIKYDKEKIAVIVLGTGKVFCTGAKEMTDAIDKIKKVVNQIKKSMVFLQRYRAYMKRNTNYPGVYE